MKEEYDFSKGKRGKYAKRYARGSNVVVLEPDVARLYRDGDASIERSGRLPKLRRLVRVPGGTRVSGKSGRVTIGVKQ